MRMTRSFPLTCWLITSRRCARPVWSPTRSLPGGWGDARATASGSRSSRRRLIRGYVKTAGAWPLEDYVLVLDPMPPLFVLRQDCYRTTTRGNRRWVTRDHDL